MPTPTAPTTRRCSSPLFALLDRDVRADEILLQGADPDELAATARTSRSCQTLRRLRRVVLALLTGMPSPSVHSFRQRAEAARDLV